MRYFTWKLELVSNILWLIVSGNLFFYSNSPQTPSNLIALIFLVTLTSSPLFYSKVRDIKSQKNPIIYLTWELLVQFFHWGWNVVLKGIQVCFRTFFKKAKKTIAYILLFLTNLVGNKNIKIKRKFCRESVSYCF